MSADVLLWSGRGRNQVRDDERGDGVGRENDDETDDAAEDPLFGFADFFIVAAGGHPFETTD